MSWLGEHPTISSRGRHDGGAAFASATAGGLDFMEQNRRGRTRESWRTTRSQSNRSLANLLTASIRWRATCSKLTYG